MRLHVSFLVGLCLLASARASAPRSVSTGDLYARITDAYMMGNFDDIDDALGRAAGRMDSFTADQKADIRYVRQALAECRPAWWVRCKKARKQMVILQPIWGKTVKVRYDPAGKQGIRIKSGSRGKVVTIAWKGDEMDSTAEGMYGYLRGDMTGGTIWGMLNRAKMLSELPLESLAKMNDREKLRLNRYMSFRSNLTAFYYCTPSARRYAMHVYMASFYYDKWGKDPRSGARRAACAMVLCEVLDAPTLYPSLKLPPNLPARGAEEALGQHYKRAIKRGATWTIAEDRRFRQAIKRFAAANDKSVLRTEKVTLPNGLLFAMDAKADEPLRPKRDAWIKQQFDKAKAPGK